MIYFKSEMDELNYIAFAIPFFLLFIGLELVFGRPADFDASLRTWAERHFLAKHKQRTKQQRFKAYVLAQLIITIAGLFVLSLVESQLSDFPKVLASLLLLLTLVNIGCILEQRRWVFYLEWVRFSLLAIGMYLYWPHTVLLALGLILLVGYLLYFRELKRRYLFSLYGRN